MYGDDTISASAVHESTVMQSMIVPYELSSFVVPIQTKCAFPTQLDQEGRIRTGRTKAPEIMDASFARHYVERVSCRKLNVWSLHNERTLKYSF